LPAIQKWYTQKTKNYDKSTTEAIFMPQWGEGLLHTLDDGTRLAVFPVWREANIQYYELGFVRRLAVKLNADNQVLSGEILEMISRKSYLKTHKNNIPQWYYDKTLKNEDALVYTYEVNPNDIKSNKSVGCSTPGEWYVRWVQSTCSYELVYKGGCSRTEVVYQTYPSICGSDGGAGGGGGFIGTSGGDNPNPVYGPGDDPTGGIDAGDNTTPTKERNIQLDTAFFNNKKAKCVYEQLKNAVESTSTDNLFYRLTLPFSGNGPKLEIQLKDSLDYDAFGSTSSKDLPTKIIMKLSKRLLERHTPTEFACTILHELMHAYFLAKLQEIGGLSNLNTYVNNLQQQGKAVPSTYLDLKWAYGNFPGTTSDLHSKPHHNLMARPTYLKLMTEALKAWDGGLSTATPAEYEASAWGGLNYDDVATWKAKTQSAKDSVMINWQNFQNKTSRCN
jgi:hypothetical protein